MPDYLKVLIPSAIGFATTICAVYFTASWAVKRTFKERWWERKEQAYSEIIDALHDMLRYSGIKAGEEREQQRWEHPKADEFSNRYSEAHWRIQKMTDIGPFVISDRAAEILKNLRDRPKLNWEDDPPLDVREQECAHYREALEGIRECARADLGV